MAEQYINPNVMPNPEPVAVPVQEPAAVPEQEPAVVPDLETAPVPDLAPKYKLARYIYLSSGEGIYISGCPFAHKYFVKERLAFLDELIDVKKECSDIVEVIEKAAGATCLFDDSAVPRRSSLIFALAYCCRVKNQEMRTLCYKLLPICCTNIDELILFIKFCHDLNNQGWGGGMRKAINRWYLSKEPMELAKILSGCKSRHGWSHKDILCLTRPNPENIEYKLLMTYAVKGYKEYITALNNLADESIKAQMLNSPVSKYLTEVTHFKVDQVVHSAIARYKDNKLTIGHIPQSLLQRDEFLIELIPQLPAKHLFKLFLQLSRKKLDLKSTNPNTQSLSITVAQTLKNYLALEKGYLNKIHCVDLIILRENYTNGCKPWKHPRKKISQTPKKGSKDDSKPNMADSKFLESIDKLINFAADQDTKTEKMRILLMLDYPKKESNPMCFQNAHVSIKTAMATFCRYMNKRTYALSFSIFSGINVYDTLHPSRRVISEYMKVLETFEKRGPTLMDAPMQWASNQNKKFDVFINVIVNQRTVNHAARNFNPSSHAATPKKKKGQTAHAPYRRMHPIDALMAYRAKRKHDKPAKLVTICLGDRHLNVAKGRPTLGCIDIVGFDENVPRILDSFMNGHFE